MTRGPVKSVLPSIIAFLIVFGLQIGTRPAGALGLRDQLGHPPASVPESSAVLSPEVQAALATLAPGATLSVIVRLRDQVDVSTINAPNQAVRRTRIIQALQTVASTSQVDIIAALQAKKSQGKVTKIVPFWILNGLALDATSDVIREIAARSDVLRISANAIVAEPRRVPSSGPPEPNISLINAPALWKLGFQGQGVVVATMDSGVDMTNPDLAARWRGGTNSWYDPNGQHPLFPLDLSGHGTATMGILVGGSSGGTAIGVAPAAQWIAVKIFDDRGQSTIATIHLGFQWLLNPNNNPSDPGTPQVVNNSWTLGSPGCDLELQPDLQVLRAAGVVPVFAAGNYGPGGNTSPSPANYPEALSVGATDNTDHISPLSSHGPSACGEAPRTFPNLVAPGVNIHTADLFGGYQNVTGTSVSAPHVAGALALILSAFPGLSPDQQQSALQVSAVDLGLGDPNNTYGYGRIDVLAAYNALAAQRLTPSPSATGTSTPTPVPSASPTLTTTKTPTATATHRPSRTPTRTVTPRATSTPVDDCDDDGHQSGGIVFAFSGSPPVECGPWRLPLLDQASAPIADPVSTT